MKIVKKNIYKYIYIIYINYIIGIYYNDDLNNKAFFRVIIYYLLLKHVLLFFN